MIILQRLTRKILKQNNYPSFEALLSGHFRVDIYDGAFADIHVDIINLQIDIVKAYVCFKGHIEYNLNVLKVCRL